MRLYRRAARVLAEHGIAGAVDVARRRLFRPHGRALDPQMAAVKGAYEKLVASFREHTRGIGIEGFDKYYWYHTIDLGGGSRDTRGL